MENNHSAVTKRDARIYDLNGSESSRKIIATIPKSTILIIERYESGTLRTSYGKVVGYLSPYDIEFNDPSSYEILKKESYSKASVEAQKKEKARRLEREKALKSKYSNDAAQRIIDGKVWIGMTKEMLIDSWGKPSDDHINRTVGSWGVHEQWVYGGTNIYLENDKVTSWQD